MIFEKTSCTLTNSIKPFIIQMITTVILRAVNEMSGELEIKGRLIEEYQRLLRIREAAVKENSAETLKVIDKEIRFLKLKLQPLELPEE